MRRTSSRRPYSERPPAGRRKRIGIFGGTFNPIHIAHLRCAEEAREALLLDEVLFIPSASPPHKHNALAPALHRLRMVRLAVRGHEQFRVLDIELRREGHSYSVDTLRALRACSPPATRFVFLIGVDAFREIGSWKEYRALFALTDIAILSRPPNSVPQNLFSLLPVAVQDEFCYTTPGNGVQHNSGHQITALNVTALDISASDIRRRIHRGESIRYLVPPAVERYICRHQLYTERSLSR